ncbi:hypothetical protein H6S82_07390 [Planktothrix sp. FACHB-1355]|uniref:Uncharacterized protein n=1 Tax=Aerosakkonema funiforme FACHB-1375 TaxID=2949571 RepID=A0A926ZGN8_9CYAN|nr:hypothetical protein [Aerosakkonema funiforme FACHB-1375]MBD3558677.1 hypothetical protein [Planktothrix sp. FACHB-1355]
MLSIELSDYPLAICQAAQTIAEIDYELSAMRQLINAFEGRADMLVAANLKLKNESQRRAHRFQLLQFNQEYQKALDLVMQLNTEKTNAIAHLEYLRNQFAVAKLEARLALAQQLAGLETRELIGF